MGLLAVGVNNKIVTWRAKTKELDVTVHDASGFVGSLNTYYATFYAKKFPLRDDYGNDMEVDATSYDPNTGIFNFKLWPLYLDVSEGDYVYEVVIRDPINKVSIVQDRFTIVDSVVDYDPSIALVTDACIFWNFQSDTTDKIGTYDLDISTGNGAASYSYQAGRVPGGLYEYINLDNGVYGGLGYTQNFVSMFEASAGQIEMTQGTNTHTMAIWFNTDTSSAQATMFSNHQENQGGYDITINNGKIQVRRFEWAGTVYWSYKSVKTYNDDAWHCIMYSFDNSSGFPSWDASGTSRVYIDGVKRDEAFGHYEYQYGNRLQVGCEFIRKGGGGGTADVRWPFTGSIDDIKIWDSVLTDDQAVAYYQYGPNQYDY